MSYTNIRNEFGLCSVVIFQQINFASFLRTDVYKKFPKFLGNTRKTAQRHCYSWPLSYTFWERLLKAFSNTHAIQILKSWSKSRLKQIMLVHAIKSTRIFLLHPKVNLNKNRKQLRLNECFSELVFEWLEKLRGTSESFDTKATEMEILCLICDVKQW